MSEENSLFPAAPAPDTQRALVPLPAVNLQVLRGKGNLRPGEGEQGINAQFILNALRRWWKVATPAALVLATIAATVVFLMFEPKFEATALLEIEEQSPYVAFEPKQDGRSTSHFQTQIELMRSRWVLAPVVERLKSEPAPPREILEPPDAIAWLRKQLKVGALGASSLLSVSYTSPRADDAARIVNMVQAQYFQLRADSEAKRNGRLIRILGEEVKVRSDRVTVLRDHVRKLAKEVIGKDPFLVNREPDLPSRQPLADLRNRLVMVEVDMSVLQARIKAAEAELESAKQTMAAKTDDADSKAEAQRLSEQEAAMRDVMVDRIIAEHPQIRQQEALIVAKQARLHEIEAVARGGKKDPSYLRLEAEIASDQESLDKLLQEVRPRYQREAEMALLGRKTEAQSASINRQLDELAKLRSELAAREILKDRLEKEYEKDRDKTQQSSGDTVEYVFARDELTRAERVFEMIAHRQLQLQTEQGAPARVVLRHAAAIPEAPLEVFPYRNMGLAVLVGLCLPFGLVVLWERLMRRVNDTQDLERQSRLIVLGEIARLPARTAVARKTALISDDVRVFEESVDSLRTTLTLSEDLRDMRILAVTSAANHEGKTSVAAQLAISLARATGKRTLLIDGDMRSPDIHNVFEIPLEPGLVNVLNGECALTDAIVTRWSEQVHLLPAGKLKVSPHRLLGNGAWTSLIEKIPATYRYVIVDTPPVLAASEALVLAKAADASLICVMRDVSRLDQVRKASERLLLAGSRPIGTVLNGVPARQYAHRYGTYAYSRD